MKKEKEDYFIFCGTDEFLDELSKNEAINTDRNHMLRVRYGSIVGKAIRKEVDLRNETDK